MDITTTDVERLLYEYESELLAKRPKYSNRSNAALDTVVEIRMKLRQAVSAGGFPWQLTGAKDDPNVGKACSHCGLPITASDKYLVREFDLAVAHRECIGEPDGIACEDCEEDGEIPQL